MKKLRVCTCLPQFRGGGDKGEPLNIFAGAIAGRGRREKPLGKQKMKRNFDFVARCVLFLESPFAYISKGGRECLEMYNEVRVTFACDYVAGGRGS